MSVILVCTYTLDGENLKEKWLKDLIPYSLKLCNVVLTCIALQSTD